MTRTNILVHLRGRDFTNNPDIIRRDSVLQLIFWWRDGCGEGTYKQPNY